MHCKCTSYVRDPYEKKKINVISSEGWWLDRSRSRSLVIHEIKRCLPDPNLILNSVEDDIYVWKPNGDLIWCYFTSRIHLRSPIDFEEVLRWMVLPSRNSNVATIMKLLFQASLYYIWRERNSRLHTDVARSPSYLIGEIKNLMRLKLDPMSRAQRVLVGGLSLLATWFENF
ncbi:unnamed protein product [Brassica oleracea var. botrytis]|uniref:(rape) hypothetical protein n=1 Tax=Brassica napus TaxID=3708 RepID=A0A078G448_BRANA|nr:unnamed protein product [Brassica napus]CDY21250.1 BnaC02g28730D [Brassica napus]